jgi:pimeloyl-ACP methyl ester carboxylesterase
MPYKDHFIYTNRIRLHFIEYKKKDNLTPLILLHGLTANAHTFDGLVCKGLAEKYHLYIPDLRGRGHSDKPAYNYGIRHHAKDIIGMMDQLGLKKIAVAGHSFGGLLGIYLAVHFPERIQKVIILDAAAEMNAKVGQMLMPVFKRLDKTFASFEAYIEHTKASPTLSFWDDVMTTYYRADVKTLPDGKVRTYSSLANIIKVTIGVSNQPWRRFFSDVIQPVLLINATENYNLNEPLLPEYKAKESFRLLQNGTYLKVSGNHQTMLYGNGAEEIVEAIDAFIPEIVMAEV